ncbi:hypothetical protein DIE01_16285 [Burkholderia sp. Bp8990]|nr:hypothetical protein DIE01_16285 [Burkholderia sp. Bp8990]
MPPTHPIVQAIRSIALTAIAADPGGVVAQASQAAANAGVLAAAAQTSQQAALGSQNAASTSQVAAAASAATATQQASIVASSKLIFSTTAAGIAGTTPNQYFYVPSTNTQGSYDVWLNNAGTAQSTGITFPNLALVTALQQQVAAGVMPKFGQMSMATFTGSGNVIPIATDSNGVVILGLNSTTGYLVAALDPNVYAVSKASISTPLSQNINGGLALNQGVGPIFPILTDSQGYVLLGWNTATNTLTGLFPAATSVSAQALNPALNGSLAMYKGGGPVYPILTDSQGYVLLGWNSQTNSITGALSPGSSTQKQTLTPLPPTEYAATAQVNHTQTYGQSLSIGAHGTPLISVTQPYSNLTFSGGVKATLAGSVGSNPGQTGTEPLVEDTYATDVAGSNSGRGETICSSMANGICELLAIENGIAPASNVMFASTAGHGGYAISQLVKGQSWYTVFTDQVRSAHSLIAALGKSHVVSNTNYVQGETDCDNNTPGTTYQSALQQLQIDMQTDIQAITGQTAPVHMLIYQTSYKAAIAPQIALAQLALSALQQRIHMVSPCYHLPFYSDGTHLTALGYYWLGKYFARSQKRLVTDRVYPPYLQPLSVVARGTSVTAYFSVPTTPLVLDSVSLASTTNYGFAIKDDTGTLTLSNIQASGNAVTFTINRALSTNPVLRYGLDYLGTGLNILNGASGNLRDSTPDTFTLSGVTYPLYHVCPHFSLPISNLQVI